MGTNPCISNLAEQIEQLVREHLTAVRTAAEAAIERALTEAKTASVPQPQRAKRVTKSTPRRTAEEITALSEQLYLAVCQMPGETMAVLASVVGVSSRELGVPAAKLKSAGRVRSVGERCNTRYFPMISDAKAGKEAQS